ncbi:tetratricopeptide repeat protein [Acidithiobacillus sp. IBUN Pt1247-S3]|uniref:tetratricopeptide repeat protein n=1 Tax=Acidithiobacillus sp. IBUN Pt1247-S3 TaxID=3166642 RepID=UPI0034E4F704
MTQTVAKNGGTIRNIGALTSPAHCPQGLPGLQAAEAGAIVSALHRTGNCMGGKAWRCWAGLILLGLASMAEASVQLTGEDLYYLLSAEFATQKHDPEIAIPAWKHSVDQLPTAAVLAAASKAAAQLGDLSQALRWAKRWHELAPEDSESARFEAGLLLADGQEPAAIDLLQATLARFPEDERVSSELAELLAQHGRFGDAERLLHTVIQNHPDSAAAQLTLGRLALLQKHPRRAAEAFAKALQLRPDWEEAVVLYAESLRQQGSSLAALQTVQDFCAAHPSATDARAYLAKLYLNLGGQTQAYRVLQQLSLLRPDEPKIWDQLLLLAIGESDWTGAQQALEHLRELSPHSPLNSYYQGRIAEARKDWPKAREAYEKLAGTPLADEAQLRMAQTYYAQGHKNQALLELQKLQARHPDDAQIPLLRAQLLQEEAEYGMAAQILDQALEQHPRDPALWYARGIVAEQQKDYAGMDKAMRIVIDLRPDDAQAYNFLGYSLLERHKQLPEAGAYLEKAIQIAPEDPNIQDSIGWYYHLQGDQKKALYYLQKAHAQMGDEPELLNHLGRVLWQMGQQKEARALWQRGLKKHPDSRQLQEALLHP